MNPHNPSPSGGRGPGDTVTQGHSLGLELIIYLGYPGAPLAAEDHSPLG